MAVMNSLFILKGVCNIASYKLYRGSWPYLTAGSVFAHTLVTTMLGLFWQLLAIMASVICSYVAEGIAVETICYEMYNSGRIIISWI